MDTGASVRSNVIINRDCLAALKDMPDNVKDRPARSYEHAFLFSKSSRYYYDASAIAEPIAPSTAARYMGGRSSSKYSAAVPGQRNGKVQGINRPRKEGEIKKEDISPCRNSRDVWLVNTAAYRGTHFAAFPPKLALKCILAGCPENGIVVEPFLGSGTTGLAAAENRRRKAEHKAAKSPGKYSVSDCNFFGKELLEPQRLPDIHFHQLRNTHTTILLKNDFNIKGISHMLGHSKKIISAYIYGDTQEIIEDCLYAIEPFIETVMPKSGKGE